MEQTREVVICPQCKGAGRVYRMKKDGTPYMERGQPILEYCPVCDGEGRILKITTVEYVRFPSSIVETQSREYKSGFDRLKERIRLKKEKPEEKE